MAGEEAATWYYVRAPASAPSPHRFRGLDRPVEGQPQYYPEMATTGMANVTRMSQNHG